MNDVLVVDDDPHILKTPRITLHAHGCSVATAADGESALLTAARHPLGAIIRDRGLPDIDGTTVVTRQRACSTVPIPALSARHGHNDKAEAPVAGEDDYITKPFGLDELPARLRALHRRTIDTDKESTVMTTASFTVDLAMKRVTLAIS